MARDARWVHGSGLINRRHTQYTCLTPMLQSIVCDFCAVKKPQMQWPTSCRIATHSDQGDPPSFHQHTTTTQQPHTPSNIPPPPPPPDTTPFPPSHPNYTPQCPRSCRWVRTRTWQSSARCTRICASSPASWTSTPRTQASRQHWAAHASAATRTTWCWRTRGRA